MPCALPCSDVLLANMIHWRSTRCCGWGLAPPALQATLKRKRGVDAALYRNPAAAPVIGGEERWWREACSRRRVWRLRARTRRSAPSRFAAGAAAGKRGLRCRGLKPARRQRAISTLLLNYIAVALNHLISGPCGFSPVLAQAHQLGDLDIMVGTPRHRRAGASRWAGRLRDPSRLLVHGIRFRSGCWRQSGSRQLVDCCRALTPLLALMSARGRTRRAVEIVAGTANCSLTVGLATAARLRLLAAESAAIVLACRLADPTVG
jgi:hypothetical protein